MVDLPFWLETSGELLFQGQPEPDKDTPKLKAGTIIFFPSFLVHSVQPVTKGIRNSVVLWYSLSM